MKTLFIASLTLLIQTSLSVACPDLNGNFSMQGKEEDGQQRTFVETYQIRQLDCTYLVTKHAFKYSDGFEPNQILDLSPRTSTAQNYFFTDKDFVIQNFGTNPTYLMDLTIFSLNDNGNLMVKINHYDASGTATYNYKKEFVRQ